jgi:hypothetical protein
MMTLEMSIIFWEDPLSNGPVIRLALKRDSGPSVTQWLAMREFIL